MRASYIDGTYSGTSTPTVVITDTSNVSTQSIFSFQNFTVPLSINSSGLYQLTLSQPNSQVKYLTSKTDFTSTVDSVGFFLNWELVDPSGNRLDKLSPNVGNIFFTDTSQTLVLSTDETQSGVWNLILTGTNNIPIGDSLILTSEVLPTTQSCFKSDRDEISYRYMNVGDTRIDSFVVTNIGNIPLNIASINSSSPQIILDPTSVSVPPLQSVTIRVTSTPVDTGDFTGTITLNHNGSSSPDTIHVSASVLPIGFIIAEYEISNRWNMVSLPLEVSDPRKEILYPSAISSAFAYNPGSGYVSVDTLRIARGYWLKFDSDQFVEMIGMTISEDTIPVLEGWNLIGSITTPLGALSLSSDPPGMITSQFFGYGTSYVTSDTLYPSKGYWVKVNQAGSLILSSPATSLGKLSASQIRIVPTSELPPPPPDGNSNTILIPKQFVLEQNYPNPFNPTTVFRYQLPIASKVTLRIYNVLGQEIVTLVDDWQDAGNRTVEWNASNFSSGVYFYRLHAGSFIQTKKLILMR